jgi:hypothetical protein
MLNPLGINQEKKLRGDQVPELFSKTALEQSKGKRRFQKLIKAMDLFCVYSWPGTFVDAYL